jgi:transcriptional regulator with XRE-family HTH domain
MSTFTIGRFIYKEHKETFGQRLKRIRKAKKLTQTALAKKVGVAPQYIHLYESGKYRPSLQMFEWICQALEVSSSELLGI